MRVLFMQHDHVSPPGPVAEQFARRGYEVHDMLVVPEGSYDTPNVNFDFPSPDEYDALVVMGAPWGAWDDETIGRWLLPEIDWLRAADQRGVPTLGICFGGQLLARVHGGSVSRAPRPEIGWSTVWTEQPGLIEAGPWFQFHYDRWVTPPTAAEIARNSLAAQAFVLRRNLAVQFHPELTASTFAGWMGNGGRDLVIADGQDPDVLYEHLLAEDAQVNARACRLVDNFLDQVANAE